MKVLLTHRYFWPDSPPYAAILRSIGSGLVQDSHEVSVFSSIPSYRGKKKAPRHENLDGLKVSRCWVFPENKKNVLTRVLNVVLYCIALFWNIIRQKPDVVTASTFPPVVAGWSASLAAKIVGARFIYHMMDVHPEVSAFSGGRLGKGLPFRLLRWLDNQTLRRSAAIVVLSEDMAATLRARNLGDLPIHVINNFLLEDFDNKAPMQEAPSQESDRTRIIFAGNFGRFQDLPLLTEGVAICLERHPDLELLLLGNGADEAKLKSLWASHPQIKFSSFVPFSEAQSIITNADIGLVSIIPNVYRVSYPSKMLTYLGLGVPVLALVEPESHLAKAILSAKLGVIPSARTAQAIADALEALLANLDLDGTRETAIEDWVQENGSRDAAIAKWQQVVAGIVPE